MSFGENIRLFRTKKVMTQEELARQLCVSPQAVSKWERDECLPDTTLLPQIADVLGMSLDVLFEREQIGFDEVACLIAKHLRPLAERERFQTIIRVAHFCEHVLLGNGDAIKCLEEFKKREGYSDDFNSVSNETESGFSFNSIRPSMTFFSLFLEPEEGWKSVLGPDEKYREIFEILSDVRIMNAVFALYEKPRDFTFDAEYAGTHLGLEHPVCDLDKISKLRILYSETVQMDGCETRIWSFQPKCGVIGLFAILNEYLYHNRKFELSCNSRRTPYF